MSEPSSNNQFLSLLESHQSHLSSVWNLSNVFSKSVSAAKPSSESVTSNSVPSASISSTTITLPTDGTDAKQILAPNSLQDSTPVQATCGRLNTSTAKHQKLSKLMVNNSDYALHTSSSAGSDHVESSYTDVGAVRACDSPMGKLDRDGRRRFSSKEVFRILRNELKRAHEIAVDLDSRLKNSLLKLQESRVESLQVLPLRLRLRELEQSVEQLTNKLNCKENECSEQQRKITQLETDVSTLSQKVKDEKASFTLAHNRIEFLEFHEQELEIKLASSQNELKWGRQERIELESKLRQTENALSMSQQEKGHMERRATSLSKEVTRLQDLCLELKVSEPEDIIKYVRSLEARCAISGSAITCGSETVSTVGDIFSPTGCTTTTPTPPPRTISICSSDITSKSDWTPSQQPYEALEIEPMDGCFPPIIFCGWGSKHNRNQTKPKISKQRIDKT